MIEHVLSDGWEFIQTKLDHPNGVVGYSKAEWLPANVPGHIHIDLMDHGIIGDPFERMHEIGVQWVDETDWSYRCTFEWTANPDLPRRVLHFEGLDTVCTVTLNGSVIGKFDNMFVAHEVDVTDLLVEGSNQLRIDFLSPVRVGEERRTEFLTRYNLPPDMELMLERSFVRKVQCMYGWDWGPRLASCGIWKPVRLIEFAQRITDVEVQQEWHEDGSVTVHARATATSQEGLEYSLWPPDGSQAEILESTSGRFEIANPELWWPVGMGEQNLYTLVLRAETDREFEPLLVERKIGLRQIRLRRDLDEVGQSFEFEINGKTVYAKGFNWIPDHCFPSIITRDQYEERIHQAVALGSNMLRVWGGGLYESEDFYDLCDEQGVMVWQDFPFACAYYPDDDAHLAVIEQEATAQIKRLRHRACLALWCGNNENLTMWESKWNFSGGTQPDRFYGERIYNELLPSLVAELDPEHSYIPTSPIGKEGGTDANCGDFGDSHYWDVWHGRGDWKHYADSRARFSSEYGFASAPSLPVWSSVLDQEDWHHESSAARWHNKTRKEWSVFTSLVELHYPPSENLEDWVYYSQLNQRDALRFGVEHFRRNRFCRGSLIWQLNDCWPVESWAVIDSRGCYKAAAYEMPRLYGDTLLSLVRDKHLIQVHHVDDRPGGPASRNAVFANAIHLPTGEVLREWEYEFRSTPGHHQIVNELDLTGLPVSETIVHVWSGLSGDTWHLLGQPKEMRFAPPSRILASVGTHAHLGPCLMVRVQEPVVDLMLTVDGDPSPFAENFLTLGGNQLYAVPLLGSVPHFEARSLAGHHPTHVTRSPLF